MGIIPYDEIDSVPLFCAPFLLVEMLRCLLVFICFHVSLPSVNHLSRQLQQRTLLASITQTSLGLLWHVWPKVDLVVCIHCQALMLVNWGAVIGLFTTLITGLYSQADAMQSCHICSFPFPPHAFCNRPASIWQWHVMSLGLSLS